MGKPLTGVLTAAPNDKRYERFLELKYKHDVYFPKYINKHFKPNQIWFGFFFCL